jgi:hypothetical protein
LATEVSHVEAPLGAQKLVQLSAVETVKQDSALNDGFKRREEIISMLSQETSRLIPRINEKIPNPLDRAEVKKKQEIPSQYSMPKISLPQCTGESHQSQNF